MLNFDMSELRFGQNDGLIPAIAQEAGTGLVLMLAYMNAEALQKTLETGIAHYYSRSRRELWKKGETSGCFQHVVDIRMDCDKDALVVTVNQDGAACHTGNKTCFYRLLNGEPAPGQVSNEDLFKALYKTIEDRKLNPKVDSYTNYLFEKGIDKMLKKVGEEAAEVIIAAKNADPEELTYEISDLIYHLSVVMVENGVCWSDIAAELSKRRK